MDSSWSYKWRTSIFSRKVYDRLLPGTFTDGEEHLEGEKEESTNGEYEIDSEVEREEEEGFGDEVEWDEEEGHSFTRNGEPLGQPVVPITTIY